MHNILHGNNFSQSIQDIEESFSQDNKLWITYVFQNEAQLISFHRHESWKLMYDIFVSRNINIKTLF